MWSSTGTAYSYIFAFDRVIPRIRVEVRSGVIGCCFVKVVDQFHHRRAFDDD
jgi:hypothetical protein